MLNAQSIREKIQNSLMMKDLSKRTDEKSFVNPYAGDKSAILLETRAFNDSPLNAEKCCKTLTKVLYLLTLGQELTAQETTSLFFGITKLFQSKNDKLRRMIYLLIKYLNVNSAEVFIVTSSLTKDMNNTNNDCYRANAIRVLSRIVDASMAAQIDRYLKTAIVDKNPFIQSSALACGLHLLKIAPDVVKRWTSEVSSALLSKHPMVKFHALALLYQLKSSDILALQKVVTSLCENTLKSFLAECLLVRYATHVLLDSNNDNVADYGTRVSGNVDKKHLMQYLLNQVKQTQSSSSEIVVFEALRSICELLIHESKTCNSNICAANNDKNASTNNTLSNKTTYLGFDLTPIVQTIHVLLVSPKSVVRFAVIRILNKLSQYRPHLVSLCNEYMEALLSDSNRTISTLALTALLKTGHESSIDKFIKQINSFMGELTDVCKIDIVKAVKQLCITYPSKYKMIMGFLSSNLREEGSFKFKNEIVDALIFLSESMPASQEIGLLHLCEFIEDCEYPSLCTKVLCFLGEQAPNSKHPSKFIRFIYNRLILENALIRGASVDALTKIAYKCPHLRKDIMTLLECCIDDNDDEVRDRTNVYYKAIDCLEKERTKNKKSAAEIDILNDIDDGYNSTASTNCADDLSPTFVIEELLNSHIHVSVDALCNLLQERITNNETSEFINLRTIPTEDESTNQKQEVDLDLSSSTGEKEETTRTKNFGISKGGGGVAKDTGVVPNVKEFGGTVGAKIFSNEVSEKINKIVSLDLLGKCSHSCKIAQLTESEAEYGVQVIKHMYNDYVILQFIVTNTISDQKLENVSIHIVSADNGDLEGIKWEVSGKIDIQLLPYDGQECCYVVLKKLVKKNTINILSGVFHLVLKYTVKELKDDVGYEDEYPLEQLVINISDYVLPRNLRVGEFAQVWAAMEIDGVEIKTQFSICFRTIEDAIDGLIKCLNLCPCENTNKVESGKNSHNLFLSGVVNGVHTVLCRVKIVMDATHGCIMQLTCRSKVKDVCECLVESFG